jgi:disulfide bond formation protein B (disulfide oxidoreductase)
MMEKAPSVFHGFLKAMQGDGDCAIRDTVFGLRIPVWSMILFIGLLFVCIFCERSKTSRN